MELELDLGELVLEATWRNSDGDIVAVLRRDHLSPGDTVILPYPVAKISNENDKKVT